VYVNVSDLFGGSADAADRLSEREQRAIKAFAHEPTPLRLSSARSSRPSIAGDELDDLIRRALDATASPER
jgi:hypothetical protein